MEIIHNITLKFSKDRVSLPLFRTVQGDNGSRKIRATLLNDDGSAFSPDSGVDVEYWSRKADGTGTSHSAEISGNVVTVTLNEQDLACPGNVYAAICLVSGDSVLTAMPFVFENLRNAISDSITSTDDYRTIIRYASDTEAWAVGKRKGVDVPDTDPAYHNNAKYYYDRAQIIFHDITSFADGIVVVDDDEPTGEYNRIWVKETTDEVLIPTYDEFLDAESMIAPLYSDLTFPVSVGQHCVHDDKLYICNTAIASSEEWNASHWTLTTVEDEIDDIKDDVSELKADLLYGFYLEDGIIGTDFSMSKIDITAFAEAGPLSGNVGETISKLTSTSYTRVCLAVSTGEIYRVKFAVRNERATPYVYMCDANDKILWESKNDYTALADKTAVWETVRIVDGATKLYFYTYYKLSYLSYDVIAAYKVTDSITKDIQDLKTATFPQIPSYYQSYIASKAEEINELTDINVNPSVTNKANCLDQFIFFTDYHYDGSGVSADNTQNSASLIEYLQAHIGCEFVCHGGDVINNQSTQKKAIEQINGFRHKFRNIKNLFCCTGNHEFNSTETLTYAQITKLLNGSHLNIHSMDGYGDFCVDNQATNTRYIFMGCDRRSTSGSMISSPQISWFLDTLKNMTVGYDAVLMIHRILELNFDTANEEITASVYSDCEPIANGINAFNTHSTITYDNTTYDYASQTGSVMCVLTGHSHTDASMVLTSGTPIIMVTTDCCPKRHTSYDWTQSKWNNEAVSGTIEEQAFDVVTIDKEHRTVECTRIGYGQNRSFAF